VKIRHIFLVLALIACVADAAGAGLLGSSHDDPPRVAALAAVAVDTTPPRAPTVTSFPTYAPKPHISPVLPAIPTTAAPSLRSEPVITLPPTTPPTTAAPRVPPPAPTASAQLATASAPPAVVARVKGDRITVWNAPTDTRAAFALRGTTEWGNPRVFLTIERDDRWVHVMLPIRPNHAEGWVRAQDVDLALVYDVIDVNLAARTLTWWRADQMLLETSVAVGAPATPTPPGTYYVTDLLPEAPSGPYGAWVLVLNGYSEALATFDGGDPRLAIHGTNQPGSIGNAVSSGCVRVGAQDLATLAAGVPVGTPVVVE
jgi:lipoprotein-anchoring transpeptidase ErfK/SrfK